MNIKKKKNKAFTLTELLVVVVVIGVLSAVVLPKFSKVIETRRTTEAEELMSSIRTEQEKRCALDKKYITGDITQLNDIVKNPKNYTLELASTGINAKRKDKKYTLEMPSYADGRICCRGEACGGLNKNYPDCNGFTYEPSPESCKGKVEPPVPPTPPCNDCSCPSYAASHADECNSGPGPEPDCTDCSCPEYAEANPTECTPQPKECAGPKPDDKQPCNTCGEQTREVTCNTSTGAWETGSWNTCSKTEAECQEEDECCAEGFTGDFAECLAKKHGYESPEYICAKGSLGVGSGAWRCTAALGLGSGRGVDYALFRCPRKSSIKDEKEDSFYQYCKSWQEVNDAWLNNSSLGFKRYACNNKVPVNPFPSSDSDSGSGPGKCDGTYGVEEVSRTSCQGTDCASYNLSCPGGDAVIGQQCCPGDVYCWFNEVSNSGHDAFSTVSVKRVVCKRAAGSGGDPNNAW